MMHFKLTILSFFMFPMLVFGQWEEKSISTPSTLTSVKFYNNDLGFTVGGSNIYKTNNRGDTWELSFTGNSSVFLEDIFIIEAGKAIAIGKDFNTEKSIIVRTGNNGITWNSINASNSALLRSVYFPTSNVGYCSGGNGSILKSIDSGNSWQALSSGTSQNLQSIFFVDELNGIAVGGSPSSSIVLKTTDGGENWNEVSTPSDKNLQSVYFVSQQVGYIVGWNGEIMKTMDGGNTWTPQTSVAMSGNLEVFFTNANTGYIVGGNLNESLIQKTNNGGALWEDISPNINQGLVSIHFPSFSTGYAVGENGTVLKTTSGGVTSTTQEIVHSPDIVTYPNPVVEYLSMRSIEPVIIESVKMYDSNGDFIYQAAVNASSGRINFSTLEANNYFLVIQTNEGLFVKKILKI